MRQRHIVFQNSVVIETQDKDANFIQVPLYPNNQYKKKPTTTWYLIPCQGKEENPGKVATIHMAFIRTLMSVPISLLLAFQKHSGVLFLNTYTDMLLNCLYCIMQMDKTSTRQDHQLVEHKRKTTCHLGTGTEALLHTHF